jgi:hypothetical protein
MPGIFPDQDSAGGVVYRDIDGNPTNPPEVLNAYAPAPAFVADCPMTALPSNCDARIEPRQINAIVSELVAFAECLDPNGPWNCNDITNLCRAFTAWLSVRNAELAQAGCKVFISPTPPVAAEELLDRMLWWESDTGVLYIRYDDGNSKQWVSAIPSTAGGSYLLKTGHQIIEGGFGVKSYDNMAFPLSFTPNPYNGNSQYGINTGMSSWTVPPYDCTMDVLVTNTATAGVITLSGYVKGTGDPLTAINGDRFIISIKCINGVSTYAVKALQ